MKIKDLMEKLSKMDKNQELIVEGLEDEVETTEVETSAPEKHPQEQMIDTMIDNKLAKGGHINAPTADGSISDTHIAKYATNIDSSTKLKKCKLIAKVLAFRDGYLYGVDENGRSIDAEDYLDQYPEMKAWWDEHKAEIAAQYGNRVYEGDEELEELDGIECPFCGQMKQEDEMTYYDGDYMCQNCVDNQMNGSSEIDECGSACGKMTECGKTPIKEGKEETKVEEIISDINNTNQVDGNGFPLNEYDEPIDLDYLKRTYSDTNEEILKQVLKHYEQVASEDAEVIEARLNEQMKTDYQKELEAISDFLF